MGAVVGLVIIGALIVAGLRWMARLDARAWERYEQNKVAGTLRARPPDRRHHARGIGLGHVWRADRDDPRYPRDRRD